MKTCISLWLCVFQPSIETDNGKGRSMRTIAIVFVMLVYRDSLLAEEPREKPKELEALGQYVGGWTSDVTSKPAEWSPNEIKYRTTNHATWMLDGWFLMHTEVNHLVDDPSQVGKSLFVWTYDPGLKKYVGWAFQSSGNISKVTGTWDAVSRTFSHVESEPPPNTSSKLTETFVGNDAINGSLVFTSNDGGRKLFDMVWTRTRRDGKPSQDHHERWALISIKPIQPIPPETKRLNTGNGRWILDGRWERGESNTGNVQSQWVRGYDTSKKAYRYVRFTSLGQIEELIGQWDEARSSITWQAAGQKAQP